MIRLLMLLTFISCAKTSYLIEQGIGQVALEWNGRSNEKVLADQKVSKEHKRKIRLIEKARAYFHQYFEMEETDIYDETTFLDQEAVTYLVIASPKNEIKALRVSFPIMGSFPYLGFFNESSAKEYKKEKEEEGYHTYMRKVYAYSTLNQWIFDDNILSSFFKLKDEQLVELIFHELVHTVIFVKDDIAFNENLAQFIGRKLVSEYFQHDDEKKKQLLKAMATGKELRKLIVSHSKKLNELYKQTSDYKGTLQNYIKNQFEPSIEMKCAEMKIKTCWPLKEQWNNAHFAAFGTYAAKQNQIAKLYSKTGKDLKGFFSWIMKKYDKFDGDQKFLTFLQTEN